MKKDYNFKLIKGIFPPSEFARVIFEMISSKINYHTLENFTSQELFGKDAPHSKKRIQDLKKVELGLKKLIESAVKKGVKLKVEGNIKITVVDK